MITRAVFEEQVRQALAHLHDYERLRDLLLGRWLKAEPGYTGKGTLHRMLLDAIQALRPPAGTPPAAPAWRTYQILFYRFVQGMAVGEVASQLGFGDRHFRRQQARAIRLLADWLWEHYRIDEVEGPPPGEGEDPGRQADVNANLAWIEREHTPQQVSLDEVMPGVVRVLNRLLTAQGVRFALDLPTDLPPLSIHRSALRQILVSTLSYAVGLVPGGSVEVQCRSLDTVVVLRIALRAREGALPPVPADGDALAIPCRLLAMHSGSLRVTPDGYGGLTIDVRVPVSRRLPVLIVDDNPDTARLFARYLADSRYQPVVARSGQEALTLAPEVEPRAIVLDVMTPAQDGWEVLSLLKAHPRLERIPVIVATILTDRELALSLGAAEFLHKPVSQTANLDLAEVEDIIDEVRKVLCVTEDHLEIGEERRRQASSGIGARVAQDDLGKAGDHVDRHAQLVTDIGDELVYVVSQTAGSNAGDPA